jgi:hypothetical protein
VTAVDEEGHSLSDDQIKDNLLLVLFAGHDTSSTTLTRMLSVLQKVRDVRGWGRGGWACGWAHPLGSLADDQPCTSSASPPPPHTHTYTHTGTCHGTSSAPPRSLLPPCHPIYTEATPFY